MNMPRKQECLKSELIRYGTVNELTQGNQKQFERDNPFLTPPGDGGGLTPVS